jgi:hypothetical protein
MTDRDTNPLYDLLPSVFRQADQAEGQPLRALTDVLGIVDGELHRGIGALYDCWFIETCPLPFVAMIGALVGVTLPTPIRPEHRALVADALASRRRKGTAAALPIFLRATSDWYVLVLNDGQVPGAAWPLQDTDGTSIYQSDDWGIAARNGMPPAGLWVWRLPVLGLEAATPAMTVLPNWQTWGRRFWLNRLGLPQQVWNVAGSTLPLGPAPLPALPVAVTTQMLSRDLARYRRDWPVAGPGAPADSVLYGPGRGLLLSAQRADGTWVDVSPRDIRPMALDDIDLPPPHYPVFLSGPIDLKDWPGYSYGLNVLLGDTEGHINFLPEQPTMTSIANCLQVGFQSNTTQLVQGQFWDNLTNTTVVPRSDRLVLIPGGAVAVPWFFVSDTDYLGLTTPSQPVLALRTLPLSETLLGRLYTVPAGSLLNFTDAYGQVYTIPLPLPMDGFGPPALDATATALQKLLPTTIVLGIASDSATTGQIVIIPSLPDAGVPVATTAPANTPEMAALAWDLGLVSAVVLDPEAGQFAWPVSVDAPIAIAASYGYAAVTSLGGGPYPRQALQIGAAAIRYPVTPGGSTSLDAALAQWASAAPPEAVLALAGSASFFLDPPPPISLAGGQILLIQAGLQQGPVVIPSQPLLLSCSSGEAAGTLMLDGLVLEGGLSLGDGQIALTLADTTLFPVSLLVPTSGAELRGLELLAERCVLGPMAGNGLAAGSLQITDSLVSSLPVPLFEAPLLAGWAAEIATTVLRSTFFGGVTLLGPLKATDSLFVGVLESFGRLDLDHCYVTDLIINPPRGKPAEHPAADNPPDASVMRCTTCKGLTSVRLRRCHVQSLSLDPARLNWCTCNEPSESEPHPCDECTVEGCASSCPLKQAGQFWSPLRLLPNFYSDNVYPNADFGRLSSDNPPALLSGASDQGEIGVFNRAQTSARARQFADALGGALLFGTGAEILFQS